MTLFKNILFLTAYSIIQLISIPFSVSAQQSQLILQCGYFTKDMSRNSIAEMDESLKQWVETIKRNTKLKLLASSKVINTFYDSKEHLVEGITSGKLDFMNLSTYDFFDLDLQNKIIPLLATSKTRENNYERYLLISNFSSEVNSISQLGKTRIIIPNSFSSALIKIWLQVELKEKTSKNSFSSIEIFISEKKENEILFALFFKKHEFAVIKEDSYLTACEINPQIRNNTKIVAVSQKYINNFFARRIDLDPEIYQEVEKVGLSLDQSIEGKQVLSLMQMSNMHKIDLQDLSDTRELITKYKKLFTREIRRK